MKLKGTLATLMVSLMFGHAAFAVSDFAFESGAIHTFGDNGSANYYGSGADDGFEEYGIASFNFTAADFGGPITDADVVSVTLSVVHNDRSFTDATAVEFYYTPDDFDATYTGLSFVGSMGGGSDVTGIDPTQYATAPVSVGFLPHDPDPSLGGMYVDYALTFSGATLSSLVSEINAGSDFQISVHAPSVTEDVTFTGVGEMMFDPGDPILTIVVPEPASGFGLAMLLALGFVARRK